MSGDPVGFVGDAMAAVVQGIVETQAIVGQPPVVVGGLAVLARLSTPYRATVDLDVVDRGHGPDSHLELLRSAPEATPVEPAAVLLPTRFGLVKVDVLAVRQAELDMPSDDAGDRLHASAHAWAYDTASPMTLAAVSSTGGTVQVTTPVAEPGPLVAMKLQAVMNRGADKQGTDLLDIVRLVSDGAARPLLLEQLRSVAVGVASDVADHVDLHLVRERRRTLRWIHRSGGDDVTRDDLDLVADLLQDATRRAPH